MKAQPLLVDDSRHGSVNAYNNYRCRCDLCKAAMKVHQAAKYARMHLDECACGKPKRKGANRCQSCYNAAREAPHGTESRYDRCHCDECTRASTEGRKRRRHEAKRRRA